MASSAEKVTKPIEGLTSQQLAQEIQQWIQSKANGTLELHTGSGQTWTLDFRVGRLIWIATDEQRFRRWQRLVKQFASDLDPQAMQLREQEIMPRWEYLVLTVLQKRQLMTREVATNWIATALIEILFDLLQQAPAMTQIVYSPDRQLHEEPIAILSCTDLLSHSLRLLTAWNQAGLENISPNLAPLVLNREALAQSTSPKTYDTLVHLLNGKMALRDLALIMRQDLVPLGQVIEGYHQRQIIKFQPLADLPSPIDRRPPQKPRAASASQTQTQPLVLCIDDSPQICYVMEQIIQGSGYRFIGIQDSIQALPLLLKQRPAMIFLDLVMPIASGYEICSQIRRVAGFKQVPIVILTGNDGIVDRLRAKSVGATDFLSKPATAEQVMAMVRRYAALPGQAPAPAASGSRTQFRFRES
jgi:two-component system, chemotaxis family, response regulator PixG